MEKNEAMWSVLYNLDAYSGREAQQFEKLCYHNIELKQEMDKWELSRDP